MRSIAKLGMIAGLLTAVGASGACAGPVREPTIVSGALGQRLDDYLTRLSRYGYGFSVAAAEGDKTILQKSYGAGIAPDTVFNIASVSKQFTATAILTLAARGRLGLDDPVRKFFPFAAPAFDHVTIDELLAHTSGLVDDYALYAKDPPLARDAYLRLVLSRSLAGPPGLKWRYSNDGYALLAKIVELASGSPFKTYLRHSLFVPAGLRETAFLGDRSWPAAQRNLPTGGSIAPFAWRDRWAGGYGASDVLSTSADLLRWQRALDGGIILPPAWRAKLTARVIDVVPPILAYARGWWRRSVTLAGQPVLDIFHSGHEDDGSNAWFSHYPDRGLTLIFLSGQSVDDYPLRESVFSAGHRAGALEAIAFGGSVDLPPAVIASGDLRPFAGRYRLDDDDWIEAFDHNPYLELLPHGQRAFDVLLPDALRPRAEPALAALTQRTRTILTDLAAGNSASFVTAVGRRDDGTVLKPPREPRFKVLGTAPVADFTSDRNDLVTFVLTAPGRSAQLQHWYWNGEQLANIYTSASPPVPLFRRTGSATFANLNPFRHDSAVIRFAGGNLVAAGLVAKRVNSF